MKKELDEPNRKIRHLRKKHNGMIHKRNSLRKVIEDLKHVNKPEPMPEPKWIVGETEQVFRGAYRSYRVNGRPKKDVETFFSRIRSTVIDIIERELKTHNSAKIQMTTWIRFAKDNDQINLAFNSKMTSIYRASDLKQIVNEMFSHMRFQIENLALLNSKFILDDILFLDINFPLLNLTRGSSYLPLPKYIAKKKVIINPQNGDEECFK